MERPCGSLRFSCRIDFDIFCWKRNFLFYLRKKMHKLCKLLLVIGILLNNAFVTPLLPIDPSRRIQRSEEDVWIPSTHHDWFTINFFSSTERLSHVRRLLFFSQVIFVVLYGNLTQQISRTSSRFIDAIGIEQMEANPDAKRLYDDLLSNYNRLIRPVVNNTETLTVRLGLKLSQLIEVNLKSQVMTTNVWVEQKWTDYKLRWDPEEYGGVEMLYVPSEHIWLPDIVLYNNADGNYEVTLMTKATLTYDGEVYWKPPAIYKSSCEINVLYFPFDEQSCYMKFGSWTYHGYQVDLKHMDQTPGSNLVPIGIDLKEFYLSVEWDILEVPARKNEEYYPCCAEPYSDITFNLKMRRKTLFYTVNLIIPCVGITFLTVLVFYLPSDSGEKVTLTVSILLSLTVFFLLLAEIIPPTSLAVPLLGKYLLFTMMLVTLSIFVTVVVLNIYFRSPSTHKMSPWVKTVFLDFIPRLLMMRRPSYHGGYEDNGNGNGDGNGDIDWMNPGCCAHREPFYESYPELKGSPEFESVPTVYKHSFGGEGDTENNRLVPSCDSEAYIPRTLSPDMLRALEGVCFIAQHIKDADKDNEVVEDWKYVSMVLDRFFLWVFTLACIGGTCAIIFQAPSLYDQRIPIDQEISLIQFGKIFLNVPTEMTFKE